MSKGADGKAGRLGDDTRARINDLKGGWKLPAAANGDTAKEAAPSDDGDDLDEALDELPTVEISDEQKIRKAEAAARAEVARGAARARKTAPPKLPALPSVKPPTSEGRARTPSAAPPPPPKRATAKNSQPPPLPRKADASGPNRASSASIPPPPPGKESGARPSSLPPAPIVSPDGADDDEPTRVASREEPAAPAPKPAQDAQGKETGSVRLPDSIPRQPGVLGDLAYVFRVLKTKRSAATELKALEVRIASEKEARQSKLLEYARHAVGDDSFDQTLVGRARASLLDIEEKRSLHAGRIASANEKVAALERQRSDVKSKRDSEIAGLETEIASIETALEPLLERASEARKRTTKLRVQLGAIDEQILKKEASLVAVTGQADKASVHAEVASLKAERSTVAADEPKIAAEVDEVEPKIASLKAQQDDLREQIERLRADEKLDVVRTQEKADAVNASRVVEERAVSDQAAKQEKELLELGEGLHRSPPDAEDPKAIAIMRHDVEIATLQRRSLELTELVGSVERGPLVRGYLYLGCLAVLPLGVAAALLLT